MSKKTIAAQMDDGSPLYETFREYEETGGFESTSEAVRSAMRAGLEESSAVDVAYTPAQRVLWGATIAFAVFGIAVAAGGLLSVMDPLVAINASILMGGLASLSFGAVKHNAPARLAGLLPVEVSAKGGERA